MTDKDDILALSRKIDKLKHSREKIWNKISDDVGKMESLYKDITRHYGLIADHFGIAYYKHDQLTIEKFLEFYKNDI